MAMTSSCLRKDVAASGAVSSAVTEEAGSELSRGSTLSAADR